ncbi:MAG: sec-independent protein translocase TatC [Pseudopedobacter saltans]|uniref:Sec-independent protein translocase TatC n=1 Tax=Pseudopedobacter saltans TaxID=151895 RepID=A0A2W5FEC0_9SPHI|nr:MAG: sec-independent protein translocase TatC [Pseudopedobacter saltans]
MKSDIQTREDVELLVNSFYDKVKLNGTIGPIFNNVILDWDEHLPKMYSFWSSILLEEHSYSGNPMSIHIRMSKTVPLQEKEFSEWLRLFAQTINDLFVGEKAEEAKTRATNIARLMQYKIERGY